MNLLEVGPEALATMPGTIDGGFMPSGNIEAVAATTQKPADLYMGIYREWLVGSEMPPSKADLSMLHGLAMAVQTHRQELMRQQNINDSIRFDQRTQIIIETARRLGLPPLEFVPLDEAQASEAASGRSQYLTEALQSV